MLERYLRVYLLSHKKIQWNHRYAYMVFVKTPVSNVKRSFPKVVPIKNYITLATIDKIHSLAIFSVILSTLLLRIIWRMEIADKSTDQNRTAARVYRLIDDLQLISTTLHRHVCYLNVEIIHIWLTQNFTVYSFIRMHGSREQNNFRVCLSKLKSLYWIRGANWIESQIFRFLL